LRGFIDQITILPGDGPLQVVGDLEKMLTAAVRGTARRLSCRV